MVDKEFFDMEIINLWYMIPRIFFMKFSLWECARLRKNDLILLKSSNTHCILYTTKYMSSNNNISYFNTYITKNQGIEFL